jgi:hypothetical protein
VTARAAVGLLSQEIDRLSRTVRQCRALADADTIDAPIVANLLAYIDALVDEVVNEMGPPELASDPPEWALAARRRHRQCHQEARSAGPSRCGRPPCYRAGHVGGEAHGCPISANDYTDTRNRANVARFH